MTIVKLNEREWKQIHTFLLACPQVKVGSARKCRRFVEAVLWVVRSGAQWRLQPKRYGKWNSVYKRFARWCEAGVWEHLFASLADDPDMEHVMLDSTIVRAHPCAAGAPKNGRPSTASLGSESRWLEYQNPYHCGRVGQSVAAVADRRPVSRQYPSASVAGGDDGSTRHCRSRLCRATVRRLDRRAGWAGGDPAAPTRESPP